MMRRLGAGARLDSNPHSAETLGKYQQSQDFNQENGWPFTRHHGLQSRDSSLNSIVRTLNGTNYLRDLTIQGLRLPDEPFSGFIYASLNNNR